MYLRICDPFMDWKANTFRELNCLNCVLMWITLKSEVFENFERAMMHASSIEYLTGYC